MQITPVDTFVYDYITHRTIRLDQVLPYSLTYQELLCLPEVGPLTQEDFLGFLKSYVYSAEVVEMFYVYFHSYVHYHIQEPLSADHWALPIIREHVSEPVKQKIIVRIQQIIEYKKEINETTPSYHALRAFFKRLQD